MADLRLSPNLGLSFGLSHRLSQKVKSPIVFYAADVSEFYQRITIGDHPEVPSPWPHAMGNVISVLGEGREHIPYRESKLVHLLRKGYCKFPCYSILFHHIHIPLHS